MDVISDRNHAQCLDDLLEFLARWKKRPACLTPMAYQWCYAISGVVASLRYSRIYTSQRHRHGYFVSKAHFRNGCDLVHSGVTYCACKCPRHFGLNGYVEFLFKTLEIGFRLAGLDHDQPILHLDHTSHRDQIFEVAFSSDDEEVIADAACAWIAGDHTPAGSCVRYFAGRVEEATPFPPRLRQVAIRAIERIWRSEFAASGLETIRLLHRLDVDVEEVEDKRGWARFLVMVIRSPMGFGSLSPHYWGLLGNLTLTTTYSVEDLALRDTEVMRSLEEAEDWEKLEVWVAAVWQMFGLPTSEPTEGIEQVTLKLALRRPSALQRFENLCARNAVWLHYKSKLQGICNQARTEQLPLETPP